MDIPSTYATATLDDVLSDLSVRFVINLPQEELVSRERVCFQVEEAHWYYEDFIREQRPEFPALSLPVFLGKIFAHNPMLSKWGMHQDAYREFMEYKHRVPVRGGILINKKMDKVILVKGWKAGASWAFPRGKINKDEADHVCAVREVLEETGFDSTDLVDPSAFLVDSSEENVDRHLQLYLIKDVPEDYNFHPLARKEISEVAWFPIADLQAQSMAQRRRREQARNNAKSGAEDSERSYPNKLRVYKVYGFLPGLSRWIKDQKRSARQTRNKKHGGVYETEPESSAVETSPQRQPKAREDRKTATPQTLLRSTPHQPQSQQEATTKAGEAGDDALSLASAKLRHMIGIGGTPAPEQTSAEPFNKLNAGQSLLAQLQGSNPGTPKEPVQGHAATGISISVSALFNASKQESQQVPQTPVETNNGSQIPIGSPPNTFNPSVRKQNNGKNGKYANNGQQSSKQVTILQRGQPLPMQTPPMQPTIATEKPPLPPPPPQAIPAQSIMTGPPQAPQATKNEFTPPSNFNQAGFNQAIPSSSSQAPQPQMHPSQSSHGSQNDASASAKQARRTVLTMDTFSPLQPAQPPSQEHQGNLLDILRGARPPPPPQPAMQLQSEESSATKSTSKSIDDILAERGVKLPQPGTPAPMPWQNTGESKLPVNGTSQSPVQSNYHSDLARALSNHTPRTPGTGGSISIKIPPPAQQKDPNHLATLMSSLGNYTPKKPTPPGTLKEPSASSPVSRKPVDTNQMSILMQSLGTYHPKKPTPPGTMKGMNVQSPVEGMENAPIVPTRPMPDLFSPSSPAQNGFIGSPTTATNPARPKPVGGSDSVGRMASFDRRSTVKPEQQQTLLGLFKSPTIDNPVVSAPSPTSILPNNFPPRAAVQQKTDKPVAAEMHRTGSLSMEQTAFLMGLLDNLATQHGSPCLGDEEGRGGTENDKKRRMRRRKRRRRRRDLTDSSEGLSALMDLDVHESFPPRYLSIYRRTSKNVNV
ncbi:mRNA-decapping enzyme subunit 2 [Orbilia blumenaviensis]|uniref:mRNA-decapping enzyme subunit 2 n=1 Tax=Orbilia blumenaviensis TaxID=1796055 RepID=A0AAV9UTJ2_9PEZI